jgi:MFS family permease
MRENVRAMPRSAWVLFTGAFVNRLGAFVLPFLTVYLTRRGYSPAQAGAAVAMFGLGGLISQAAGGVLADRIGRRNTIAFSMLASSVTTLVLWRQTSLGSIYPIMVLLGVFAELYRPASSALVTDLVPPERRVTAFTLYRLGVNLGLAVGLALGGILADRSFGLLFIGDAATSAAFGIVALVFLPHGVRVTRRDERAAERPSARASILADRGFLAFLGAVLAIQLVFTQSATTLPLHVTDAGHPTKVYGFLLALSAIVLVLFELPISSWTQHRSKTTMVAMGSLLIGGALAGLGWATSIAAMVVVILVWSLGEMIESPVASAFVADRAPSYSRGRYQAAYGSTFGIAWMFGPFLGAALYGRSPGALWLACGVLGLAGAALAVLAGRRPAPAHPA